MTRMVKLARSQMSSFKQRQIQKQGGVCPISLKVFDPKESADWVIDHDHITGEIRGILHRAANGAEGKVANAVARWGGTGMDYEKIIAFLRRMIDYLEQPGTGYIYPMHKDADERKAARAARAKKVRATRKAREAVRTRSKDNG